MLQAKATTLEIFSRKGKADSLVCRLFCVLEGLRVGAFGKGKAFNLTGLFGAREGRSWVIPLRVDTAAYR